MPLTAHSCFLLELKKDLSDLRQMISDINRQPCRNTLLNKMAEEGSTERYGRKFEEFETEEEVMIMKRMSIVVYCIREIKYIITELESVIMLKMTRRFSIDAARQNRDLIMQKLQIGV